MKALNVLVLASVLGFAVQSQAAVLGSASLSCGGSVYVETNTGISGSLKFSLPAGSKCREFQVPVLNVEGKFHRQESQYSVRSISQLGNQLVVIVNKNETVVLNLNSLESSTPSYTSGMSEYERRSLELQQQREARERAQQAAQNAAAAGAVIGEVGGALVEGLGGIER